MPGRGVHGQRDIGVDGGFEERQQRRIVEVARLVEHRRDRDRDRTLRDRPLQLVDRVVQVL